MLRVHLRRDRRAALRAAFDHGERCGVCRQSHARDWNHVERSAGDRRIRDNFLEREHATLSGSIGPMGAVGHVAGRLARRDPEDVMSPLRSDPAVGFWSCVVDPNPMRARLIEGAARSRPITTLLLFVACPRLSCGTRAFGRIDQSGHSRRGYGRLLLRS